MKNYNFLKLLLPTASILDMNYVREYENVSCLLVTHELTAYAKIVVVKKCFIRVSR